MPKNKSVGITGSFPKIGKTTIVQLVATTWTEVVLQSLVNNPAVYPTTKWCIKANATIYIAQAAHSLNQQGIQVTLPTNPATATSGTASGNFELIANTYFYFDATRVGENSLYLFGPAGNEIVRIANVSRTPYDE